MVWLGVNAGGLRMPSASFAVSGMRPVPTWKSTAAAPTPIRDGAWLVPSAKLPWQLAQLSLNSVRPSAIWAALGADCCAAVADPLLVTQAVADADQHEDEGNDRIT